MVSVLDPSLASALYHGWIQHRRHAPVAHAFRYRLFMIYLDLDEIDRFMALSRWWSFDQRNLAEVRRSDYLGAPTQPLKTALLDTIEHALGERPAGPVRMLTHGRYFGYCMNPVSFYYAWDRGSLHSIVAEITNTPWQERHRYVLPASAADETDAGYEFGFPKEFHVSPFLDMPMAYRWRLSEPGAELRIHMDAHADAHQETASRVFDATLTLTREPATGASLARVLRRYPLMTMKVFAGIHWQALQLWLKRNPVYDHPAKRSAGTGAP